MGISLRVFVETTTYVIILSDCFVTSSVHAASEKVSRSCGGMTNSMEIDIASYFFRIFLLVYRPINQNLMKPKVIVVLGLMILCCVSVCFAQSSYYIKIADVKGESTDRAHKDWIVIESFSHGLEQQTSPTGATRQRASMAFHDLTISKAVDKSTPKLMEFCAKGQVIPELELDLVANGRVYYKLTLKRARINGITTGTDRGPDGKLLDEMTISYTSATWEYWDSSGAKTSASYNAQTGN
ncbi:Hcp family type VI secretion system effector [Geojedonia litorea]|uniref:Hcp family type VI secretion system effector n=1 Tax=Geojedonia litorea TaxID=1268269 RepID=A0ABV9N324_9FLAO